MTNSDQQQEASTCCGVNSPYDLGGKDTGGENLTPTTPLKAIRKKCIDCSGDSMKEVRLCWAQRCPIYPFRMGKNPFRKRKALTDLQKNELIERLKQ